MTITDMLLAGLLAYFVWNGFRTGFVMQVVGFAGAFAAYWAAKTYSPEVSPWVGKVIPKNSLPSNVDNLALGEIGNNLVHGVMQDVYGALAFAFVFVAGLIATRFVGRALNLIVSVPGLSLLNRLAGLFVGAVIGGLVLVVLVNIGAYVPNTTIQEALQGSQIASALLKANVSHLMFAK